MTHDPQAPDPHRRRLLIAGCAGLATWGGGLLAARLRAGPASPSSPPEVVSIEEFSPSGASAGVQQVAKVSKPEAEWRSQLSTLAFEVTRRAGTEAAFSGEYAGNHADGLYRCVCCATALFDSRTKFESGTGWPSFWRPISPKNVATSTDTSFGMRREAVACRRCDAHLGHVFNDGPPPTGLRYCMNSVSLKFTPRA